MSFKLLATDFFVAGQISVEDVGLAAAQGVRTIICNRPDAETPEQPSTESLLRAAERAGIDFVHIPIVSGHFDEESVNVFCTTIQSARTPILAYCRSGMRSSCLWALASAGVLERAAIMTAAADAGYDLAPLATAIDERCGRVQSAGQ